MTNSQPTDTHPLIMTMVSNDPSLWPVIYLIRFLSYFFSFRLCCAAIRSCPDTRKRDRIDLESTLVIDDCPILQYTLCWTTECCDIYSEHTISLGVGCSVSESMLIELGSTQ